MSSYRSYRTLLFLFSLFLLISSCTSTEQATRPETGGEERDKEKSESIEKGPFNEEILSANRNRLRDLFSTQDHDIPKSYLKKDTTDNTKNRDPFDGFRVQILSTRRVSLADSTAKHFRIWADTTMAGYVPKAYVFFKQPFFKVHIGDFQLKERAVKLSRILKRRYPEAWVVHDRINPTLVPPDSVNMDKIRGN